MITLVKGASSQEIDETEKFDTNAEERSLDKDEDDTAQEAEGSS